MAVPKLSTWFPSNGKLAFGIKDENSPKLAGKNVGNDFSYVVPAGGCTLSFTDASMSVTARAAVILAGKQVYDGSLSPGAPTADRFKFRHGPAQAGKTFWLRVYGEPKKADFRFRGKLSVRAA